MFIEYKSKSLLKASKNKEIFEKKFPSANFIQFKKAESYINTCKNIAETWKYKGLKIKRLKDRKNVGSFRINKKWRVEFEFENFENFLEEEKITIIKIHPHKY